LRVKEWNSCENTVYLFIFFVFQCFFLINVINICIISIHDKSRKCTHTCTSPASKHIHETFQRKSLSASAKEINAAAQCRCKIANYSVYLPHLTLWEDNLLFDSAKSNTVITKPLCYLRPEPRGMATKRMLDSFVHFSTKGAKGRMEHTNFT